MKRLMSLATLVPCLAMAQGYLDFRMVSTQSQPFNIWFGNNVTPPAGLTQANVSSAHAAAIATWNNVSCASPKMLEVAGGASPATSTPRDTWDVFSVSPLWSTSSDPDFTQIFGSAPVLAITIPRAFGGSLQTCDIFFKGDVSWSTAGTTPAGSFDYETVQLHEFGHCLGLDENGSDSQVMWPSQNVGRQLRALSAEDRTQLCSRYPATGGFSAPCTGDGGCDAALKCVPQPTTRGVTGSMCTRGCQVGTNESCETLTCAASAAFPGFSGACMRPGDSLTHVGEACADATSCGNAVAGCQTAVTSPSGAGVWWQDGYCTQQCSNSQACPASSACFEISTGVSRCLASCRVGLADCRPGYACIELDEANPIGACVPRCYANSDCANGYECRACDGLCIATGNPQGTIGTACDDSSDCGAGLKCMQTALGGTRKQCTQPCAVGCGLCPTGSTCTAAAGGQLVCMKTCEGKGLCPQGGRCVGVQQGRVCQTPCTGNLTGAGQCPAGQSCCPVGETCGSNGECYGPDAGPICPGCNTDGGQQYVPPDGGNGPNHSGTGGCGCSAVEPFSVLLAFAVLALRRRPRSDPNHAAGAHHDEAGARRRFRRAANRRSA